MNTFGRDTFLSHYKLQLMFSITLDWAGFHFQLFIKNTFYWWTERGHYYQADYCLSYFAFSFEFMSMKGHVSDILRLISQYSSTRRSVEKFSTLSISFVGIYSVKILFHEPTGGLFFFNQEVDKCLWKCSHTHTRYLRNFLVIHKSVFSW